MRRQPGGFGGGGQGAAARGPGARGVFSPPILRRDWVIKPPARHTIAVYQHGHQSTHQPIHYSSLPCHQPFPSPICLTVQTILSGLMGCVFPRVRLVSLAPASGAGSRSVFCSPRMRTDSGRERGGGERQESGRAINAATQPQKHGKERTLSNHSSHYDGPARPDTRCNGGLQNAGRLDEPLGDEQ